MNEYKHVFHRSSVFVVRTWLATDLASQTAETNLSRTSRAITSGVNTAVSATHGTTENDLFFIHGIIVSTHLESSRLVEYIIVLSRKYEKQLADVDPSIALLWILHTLAFEGSYRKEHRGSFKKECTNEKAERAIEFGKIEKFGDTIMS